MIIINVNVKAQVLNNVFTDKNSFGPVASNNSGSNYAIIKDTLYITGSASFVKAQGVENMSFPNVMFTYFDIDHNKFYIGTQNNGLYMYDVNATNVLKYATLQATGIGTITGCTTNNGSMTSDTLYVSTTNKLFTINLHNAAIGTNTAYITTGAPRSITGITAMKYNTVTQHLLYSTGTNTGTTVHEYNSASTNYTYTVNDMEYFNGNIYYATNHGVYNSTSPAINIANDVNYNIIKSYNTNLYFADTAGHFYKNNIGNMLNYGNTVNVVSKVNSISYIGTWDGVNVNNYLWVSTDKGLFIDFANVSDTTVFPVNRSMFNNLPISYTNTVSATGIEESVLANTSGLYPVPNNGSFSYNTKFAGTLQVLNISGQVVFEQKLEEGVTKIDLNLDNGIYVSQFNCIQGKVSKKFMVIN